MLVDSHCHLNFLDLTDFDQQLDLVLATAKDNSVEQMLTVCVELSDYPMLEAIAARYPNVYISVGIHPNHAIESEVTVDQLCELAANPACIAFGETGLDYYRGEGEAERDCQQLRFRQHIEAGKRCQLPLIIHTRSAAEDTLRLMREEGAEQIGGVMHCFAESLEVAWQAIDLNFYISFSGIVTFKNAKSLQEVASKIPLERMLIETDAPYLAPVPFRGKQNHPALVKHVAEAIADLRGISYAEVAAATTDNFYRCFSRAKA